jgi:hypothetical protein
MKRLRSLGAISTQQQIGQLDVCDVASSDRGSNMMFDSFDDADISNQVSIVMDEMLSHIVFCLDLASFSNNNNNNSNSSNEFDDRIISSYDSYSDQACTTKCSQTDYTLTACSQQEQSLLSSRSSSSSYLTALTGQQSASASQQQQSSSLEMCRSGGGGGRVLSNLSHNVLCSEHFYGLERVESSLEPLELSTVLYDNSRFVSNSIPTTTTQSRSSYSASMPELSLLSSSSSSALDQKHLLDVGYIGSHNLAMHASQMSSACLDTSHHLNISSEMLFSQATTDFRYQSTPKLLAVCSQPPPPPPLTLTLTQAQQQQCSPISVETKLLLPNDDNNNNNKKKKNKDELSCPRCDHIFSNQEDWEIHFIATHLI